MHLVVTDPVHVARHGTFVTTPDVEHTIASGFANVHVQTDVADDSGKAHDVSVVTSVRDGSGRTIARSRPTAVAGGSATTGIRLRRPAARGLPTSIPLYTLRTVVRVGRRDWSTSTATTFGVRWFDFDPEQGFSLDGHPMKIYGVDLHHDEGALGAAVNKDALMRQMKIMKSMGVNALRTSHNPPSPEMVEVCQELGIVMMVEAFDTWRTPKATVRLRALLRRQQRRRHPGDGQRRQELARGRAVVDRQRDPGLHVGHGRAAESPSAWSPTSRRSTPRARSSSARTSTAASRPPGRAPTSSSASSTAWGSTTTPGASVDALHARYPGTFLFESESSSETSTRGVYQDPDQLNTGENYTPGKRATSSYDNNLASWTMSGEYGLKKDRDRKYFQGASSYGSAWIIVG